MLTNLLAAYGRWVVRHRWTVLAAVLATTVLLGRAATHLRVEVDPDRQLPQDHPFIQTLNDVHRIFGDKNLVVVGLFPHDGHVFTPAFLTKLAEVTERIRRIPGANQALLQSLAAPQVKAIRGTADGMEVERVMETPPADMAGAEEVRRRAFSNEAYVGTLVSADGSAAAVQASFELTPETPGYRHLHGAVLAALKAADDGTFDYSLSGPVVFLSQLSTYANRMIYFFPLALVVIGVVHYHAFRTLQALFLPLVTALLSVLWAVGLMGLLGVQFDPYNTTTPILILAVAAGHAVQVLKRFYEEFERSGDAGEAIVASLGRVGPVMIAAGTIAALSFCSLVSFQTATIRTFGLFTGFGIASALVIELTIIPAVRALLPAPRGREREREAAAHPWLDRMLHLAHRAAGRTVAPWVFGGAGRGQGALVRGLRAPDAPRADRRPVRSGRVARHPGADRAVPLPLLALGRVRGLRHAHRPRPSGGQGAAPDPRGQHVLRPEADRGGAGRGGQDVPARLPGPLHRLARLHRRGDRGDGAREDPEHPADRADHVLHRRAPA